MRQFSILRYLKQFSLLIFLFSVIGALLILVYGQSQQHYVASAVIQYANSGAKEGYTPDGAAGEGRRTHLRAGYVPGVLHRRQRSRRG